MKNPKLASLAYLTFTLAGTSGLQAQINRWTGATSGNWNTGSNWSNGGFPNAAGTDVIFNSSGLNQATLNLSANTTIRSIYFYGGNYTLSPTVAETFTIQGGGISHLGSGNFTVNNNILGVAGNDLIFNGTGSGAITLNGSINNVAQRLDKYNESDVTLANVYTTTSTSTTALRVRAGSLNLTGAGGINLGVGAQITVGAGSTFNVGVWHNNASAALVLDNSVTNNLDRITDGNQINLSTRSLIEFRGNASATSSETLGILNAGGAGSRIRIDNGSGQLANVTFTSLLVNGGLNDSNPNTNPTLMTFLVNSSDTLGVPGPTGGRVIFNTPPTLTNGVLKFGVIKTATDVNFATYNETVDEGVLLGVTEYQDSFETDINLMGSTINGDVAGSATLSSNRTANALRITSTASGQTLDGNFNLTLQNAGGFIFKGTNDYSISGSGTLNFGNFSAANAYIDSNTLTVSKTSINFGGDFAKAGDGMLVIDGNTQFSNRNIGVDDGASVDDMQISGVLQNAGSAIQKAGLGTLALTGSGDNSTFTKGASLNAGTLVLAKSSTTLQNNALGSGLISMNGGTLAARTNPAILANPVNLTQQGSSQNATHLAGDQAITFTGLIQGALTDNQSYTVSNDASAIITFGSTSNLQGFSANNATPRNSNFEFSGSGTTVIAGVIRNTDPAFANAATMTTGLSKTGSGLLILQGANTYTGFLPSGSLASTGILGGYLRADAVGALGVNNLLISEANFSSGMNAVLELGTGNTTFSRNLNTTGVNTVALGSTSGNALNSGGFASVTGTSIINLNGGTAAVTYGSTGFFSAGGNLTLGSPNVAGTVDFQNAVNLAGGTSSNQTRTLNILNGSAAIDGIISGVIANASGAGSNNGIRKVGTGTLALSNANTYTGLTTVAEGTLLANNVSGSATGSGAIAVNTTGTLGGTGTVSGTVTSTGTVAPGSNGIGTLTAGSGVLIGTVAIELNGGTSDRLNLTTDLNLTGGTLAITSLAPAAASSYIIATYTGTFTGNANPGSANTFASVTGLPSGYTIVHDTGLKQIRLEGGGGGNAYDTWAGTFPGFTPTTGDLDFDNDGVKNLLEFVLGGNPTTNDSPSIRPVVTDSSTNLVVSFGRSDISETSPLPTTVKVQVSDDLVTWNPANDITIVGDVNGTGPNGATYTVNDSGSIDAIVVTIPKLGAPKKFARVEAIR